MITSLDQVSNKKNFIYEEKEQAVKAQVILKLKAAKAFFKTTYEIIESQALALQAVKKIFEVAEKIADFVCDVFSKIFQVASNFLDNLQKLTIVSKLISLASLPFSFLKIGNYVKELFSKKNKEKINPGLGIAQELGSILQGVSTFAMGVQTFSNNTEFAASTLLPLSIVSSVLSVAGVIIEARNCFKMFKISKKLQKVSFKDQGKASLEEYHQFLQVLNEMKRGEPKSDFLKDLFHFRGELIEKKLNKIELRAKQKLDSDDVLEQEKGKKILFKLIKRLKVRVKQNIKASILSTLASTIGVIGAVLFIACPIFPVGLAVASTGTAISAGSFIYDKRCDKKLMDHLGCKRKWHEWVC